MKTKLMTPIAVALGVAALGYGAFTGIASDWNAQASPAARPEARPLEAKGGETADAERIDNPRECDRSVAVDRDCIYL
jgi:hypothetical protein